VVEFLADTVECPRYKAVCCHIEVSRCKECEHHRGVVKVTELRGVEIRDVLCGLPVTKRITRVIRETGGQDGSTE